VREIVIKSLLLALIASLASARPASAYIDPNVGGQLFQILVTGFALFSGIVLLFSRQIRTGLAKARRFLRERVGGDENADEEQE
jgi:hypothetical protein